MIELGSKVRDIVTGFKGVATARMEHLFRYPEVKIEPADLDGSGKPLDAVWFEESRCEIVAPPPTVKKESE